MNSKYYSKLFQVNLVEAVGFRESLSLEKFDLYLAVCQEAYLDRRRGILGTMIKVYLALI